MPIAACEFMGSSVWIVVVVAFFVVIGIDGHYGLKASIIVNGAVLVIGCAMRAKQGGRCVHDLLCTMSCTLRASAAMRRISW